MDSKSSFPSGEQHHDGLHTLAGNDDAEAQRSDAIAPIVPPTDDREMIQASKEADTRAHQKLSMSEAFRRNYKACLWSMSLTLAIVMEGYDIQLIASFFGQASFLDKFGQLDPSTGKKYISAPWQSGISNAALCGEIIGLLINGVVQERFGHRKVMIVSLFWLIAAVFTPVFAPSLPVLCVGAILQGIPWGIFQTLTTAYAVEICPQAVRHYLTTFVDVCWIAGAALGSGVLRGCLRIDGQWGYRLPYSLQWVFPIPLLLVASFCPDSPWWLVRKGRIDDARRSLQRMAVAPYENDETVADTLAMMQHTTKIERAQMRKSSWQECFRGIHLRRTEIVCLTWSLQWWCGYGLVTYATTFFQRSGLNSDASFNLNIIMQCIRILGPFISWFAMDRFGRRTIYINGAVVCCITMAVIGGLGFGQGPQYGKAIGSILVIFAFYYSATIGPVCYTIVSEIPSGPLRAKQIVLARTTYNVSLAFFGCVPACTCSIPIPACHSSSSAS